jgi:hypothetical protein
MYLQLLRQSKTYEGNKYNKNYQHHNEQEVVFVSRIGWSYQRLLNGDSSKSSDVSKTHPEGIENFALDGVVVTKHLDQLESVASVESESVLVASLNMKS